MFILVSQKIKGLPGMSLGWFQRGRWRTTRCSGQHLRLAQALPLAIDFQSFRPSVVLSAMIALCRVTQASGKPSLGLVLPLSSGVRPPE